MKILAIGLSAVAILTISACDTVEMVTIQKVSGQTSIVSATAANSVSIVKASSDGDVVCIRHGPDAIASSGFSLTGGGAGEGSSISEAEMTGRTPVLLLARDAQFELCNMYLNGVIDKSDYVKMYISQLKLYAPLMLEETKYTTITISESSESTESSMQPSNQSSNPESGPLGQPRPPGQ
jgi:hypothetical protein